MIDKSRPNSVFGRTLRICIVWSVGWLSEIVVGAQKPALVPHGLQIYRVAGVRLNFPAKAGNGNVY
jgi:hypothetical protein